MSSANELLDVLNCKINFTSSEGVYEGVITEVFTKLGTAAVSKTYLLPDRDMFGRIILPFSEISDIKVLSRPIPADKQISEEKEGRAHEDAFGHFPKELAYLVDLDGGSDIEDDLSQNEYEMKLSPHLSHLIPNDYGILDRLDNDFKAAIRHIKEQDCIGVSLEGPKISRSGVLTWLCISSKACNFLFDVVALGKSVFSNGLKSILEDHRILKIFHDCRFAADCLYHMYNVRLVNVFDTQAADSLALMQQQKDCKIKKEVKSLDSCLSYYLEIPEEFLYGSIRLVEDKKSDFFHKHRPIAHKILDVLIKNVAYLMLLKQEVERAFQVPLRRAFDVYLHCIQSATDRELILVPPVAHELPQDLLIESVHVVRYRDYVSIPPVVSSGPPYREIKDPDKKYVEIINNVQNQKKDNISQDFAHNHTEFNRQTVSKVVSNQDSQGVKQSSNPFLKKLNWDEIANKVKESKHLFPGKNTSNLIEKSQNSAFRTVIGNNSKLSEEENTELVMDMKTNDSSMYFQSMQMLRKYKAAQSMPEHHLSIADQTRPAVTELTSKPKEIGRICSSTVFPCKDISIAVCNSNTVSKKIDSAMTGKENFEPALDLNVKNNPATNTNNPSAYKNSNSARDLSELISKHINLIKKQSNPVRNAEAENGNCNSGEFLSKNQKSKISLSMIHEQRCLSNSNSLIDQNEKIKVTLTERNGTDSDFQQIDWSILHKDLPPDYSIDTNKKCRFIPG
ncbi:piRNA biogenesis protein EXD1 [Caerostris darwini]|uniref:PiRNA biogenesis protein EXD1 n=1 Tax=Caerostris darwini TaxID=1538125 RepID=A0AAV4UE74_9ARAC|nr:piRNA biogenesis protein EXD1 [Caerostris darwini]